MEFLHHTHHFEHTPWERSLETMYINHEIRCAHHSDATLGKCSFDFVPVYFEYAHGLHHLEPAPWECPLEAVSGNCELCHCAHRSNAAIWDRSFEAVCVD
eukprot:4166100-Amphidinium_carterae.1